MEPRTKKLVAINASPRSQGNTAQLVQAAVDGARAEGLPLSVESFDLYALESFMGCRGCFACKKGPKKGSCAVKDGLAPVLASIREADALVLGTPIYFGRPTAGFRALLERLCFQYLTYRTDVPSFNDRSIPVLLIVTSGVVADNYEKAGYDRMLAEQVQLLERFVGPVTTYVVGDTMHVENYEQYDWNMFDIEEKKQHFAEEFPRELAGARERGAALI